MKHGVVISMSLRYYCYIIGFKNTGLCIKIGRTVFYSQNYAQKEIKKYEISEIRFEKFLSSRHVL